MFFGQAHWKKNFSEPKSIELGEKSIMDFIGENCFDEFESAGSEIVAFVGQLINF